MNKSTVVTLQKGLPSETQVKIADIKIPDLWNLYVELKDSAKANSGRSRVYLNRQADEVLAVWNLAKDLKRNIEEDLLRG